MRARVPRLTNKTGIEIIEPYRTKVLKFNFVLYFSVKDLNMIPASAQIEVNKAPILDPTIAAYVAFVIPPSPKTVII